jgi:hypothetical protein
VAWELESNRKVKRSGTELLSLESAALLLGE